MPITTWKTLRQKVAKKLYAARFPVVSVTTSDSDSRTLVKDVVLSPAAQIEDFVEAWIIVAEQAASIAASPAVVFTASSDTTDVSFVVDDTTGLLAGDAIQFTVGSVTETARITSVDSGTTLTVVRAIQGSTAVTVAGTEAITIIGPAVGEIARVTDVDFSGSNSQLTVAPGFSGSLLSGTDYEVHYKFYPNHVRDKANEILENVRRPIYLPLTLVTDGDMESTGVGDWNATRDGGGGADPVIAKVATSTFVLHGRRVLSVPTVASTVRGRAESNVAIFLPPDTMVFCAADVYIPALTTAKFTLRDVTNGADIETAESAASGFVHFEFTATLPSTCEEVEVWLETPTASTTTHWGSVQLLPANRVVYDYPGTLEWSEDLDKVFYFPRGTGLVASTDDNAFKIFEGRQRLWSHVEHIRDETAVVPFRLQLKKGNVNKPLFIGGNVDFDTLTNDSDTTNAPEDIIVNLTYADLLDAWAQEDLANDKFEAAAAKTNRAESVRRMLGPRMLHFWKAKGRVHGTRGR